MNKKQIQRVYDLALEMWKEKHFSAYDTEHQLVLCTILAFCRVYYQTTGQEIDFQVLELPLYRSIDED